MRVLFITSRAADSDLAQAVSEESQGKVSLRQACGCEAGIAVLREVVFDAVLVHHDPPRLDAPETVDGLLTGGVSSPILALGTLPAAEMFISCCEAGADDYVCTDVTTVRDLLWMIFRATRHHETRQAYEKLKQEKSLRLRKEQDTAMQNIMDERRLLTETTGPNCTRPVPPAVREHYAQMLKTFVVMGSGNISQDIREFSRRLHTAGISAAQVAMTHSQVMEEMIRSLGTKSCRHIMHRGELLRMAVMVCAEEN